MLVATAPSSPTAQPRAPARATPLRSAPSATVCRIREAPAASERSSVPPAPATQTSPPATSASVQTERGP